MKRTLFLLGVVLLLQSTFVLAQGNVSLKYGPEIITHGKTAISSIVGGNANGFYALRKKRGRKGLLSNKTLYLEKYGPNQQQVYSKQLTVSNTGGRDLAFNDLFLVDSSLFMFTSYYSKEHDKNLGLASQISSEGVVSSKFIAIDEINATKKRNAGGFTYVLSGDSSKVLVYHDEPYERNEAEKFAFKVMDNQMNVLWSKNVVLPYSDKNFLVKNCTLDNSGNVYILGQILEKSNTAKGNRFLILHYTFEDEQFKEYSVALGDQFITDITFKTDPNNNLVCAGFYANDKNMNVNGTFYIRIDGASQNILAKRINPFTPTFTANFISKRRALKGKGLEYFSMKDLQLDDNGGAKLIAEQYFVRIVTSTSSSGATRTTYYYNYNSIILAQVNPDGTQKWLSFVPKKQITKNDYGFYSSFLTGKVGDHTYFVYNDNVKNLYKQDPKRMKNFKPRRSVPVLASIDADGKVSRSVLMGAWDKKTILKPKIATQIDPKTIIVYAVRGKRAKFGRLTFGS